MTLFFLHMLRKREICYNVSRETRLIGISSYRRGALGNIAQAGVFWYKSISVSVRERWELCRRRNDKIMEADHDGWKHFSVGVYRALSDSRMEFHLTKTTGWQRVGFISKGSMVFLITRVFKVKLLFRIWILVRNAGIFYLIEIIKYSWPRCI